MIFAKAIISPQRKIIPNPVNTVLFMFQLNLSSEINKDERPGA